MTTTRIFLVRHGETLANREFRYIGARDDALSTHGEEQACIVRRSTVHVLYCGYI